MQFSAPLSALLSGSSIIDLDGTIFVQTGLFFLAYFLLYILIFKPVMALLDAREDAIDGSRAQARQLESDLDSAREDYEAQLKKVRSAANAERDRLKAEGQKTERAVLDKVKGETQGLLASANTRLDTEAATARKELSAAVPALASDIAGKILGREVKA